MFFVTLFIAFAFAYAIPNPQEITIKSIVKAHRLCKANFPPELEEIIDQIKTTKTLPENPSEDFKCFVHCMGKELGIIDETGQYHFEKLKKTTLELVNNAMTEEEAHKAVEECISVDHDKECEKANLFVQCHHPNVKHHELHDDLKNA